MKWPDWFGRKAKAKLEEIEQCHREALGAWGTVAGELDKANENNLRLIADLRQMDQWTYQLVQHAPNWKLMQPIVARMNEVVEKRMENESKRVRDLVVGEIVTAYNEPRKLAATPDNWRLLNQGKPVKTIENDPTLHELHPVWKDKK